MEYTLEQYLLTVMEPDLSSFACSSLAEPGVQEGWIPFLLLARRHSQGRLRTPWGGADYHSQRQAVQSRPTADPIQAGWG